MPPVAGKPFAGRGRKPRSHAACGGKAVCEGATKKYIKKRAGTDPPLCIYQAANKKGWSRFSALRRTRFTGSALFYSV